MMLFNIYLMIFFSLSRFLLFTLKMIRSNNLNLYNAWFKTDFFAYQIDFFQKLF